jgi:hypothetical protein
MPGLEKMTVIAYADKNFVGNGGKRVEVLMNPGKYKHAYKICYSDLKVPGSSGASSKFNRVPADIVDFELVFDATGVVTGKMPGIVFETVEDVYAQIRKFKDVVFKFNEAIHQPNYVQLAWGSLIFNCQLDSMDINYTLFQPDGAPLRAKAAVSFRGFESEKMLEWKAKKKSPDLTRVIRVKEGDTLPLLCYRIYGDPGYFIQVAEKNNLTQFRELKPDTDIVFPPIKK